MDKKIRRILSAIMMPTLIMGLAACGGAPADGASGTESQTSQDGERRQGTVKLSFWAEVGSANQQVLLEAVENFNNTHENIAVTLVPQTTGYAANLSGALRGSNVPDVVMIDDKYFKGYVQEGYLANLDELIAKDTDFSLEGMWESAVNRFSFDPETGYSGTGDHYYAVPGGNNPTVLLYNETLFAEQNINVISVEEEELDGYNSANGSRYLGHGYYVYESAPADGLKAAGDGTYRVFNNRIPMNWEELVQLSQIFTKSYNSSSSSNFGFLNEWWFSHGWSVGGDCLEWDDTSGQYIFNLGDDSPNYLVTGSETVTVNGTSYQAGDVISYADKNYVNGHLSDSDIAGYIGSEQLYELPSIRDAFTEFVRLSQTTGRTVTGDVKGYGISPSPTTLGNNSKASYFTTGEVATVVLSWSECRNVGEVMKTLGKEWNVAPLYQYREYNGDGSIKTVNGTPVCGREAGHSYINGYAVPANAKNQEAAWEFVRYMAGEEGQSRLMKTQLIVPNQISLAESDAFLLDTDNYSAGNKAAVVDMAAIASVGDWSYVEDGEWINGWANILNTKVRDGDMTLDDFFSDATVLETNELLKKYTSKKYNK